MFDYENYIKKAKIPGELKTLSVDKMKELALNSFRCSDYVFLPISKELVNFIFFEKVQYSISYEQYKIICDFKIQLHNLGKQKVYDLLNLRGEIIKW